METDYNQLNTLSQLLQVLWLSCKKRFKNIMVCYPCEISFYIFLLEQGWRSGDSTRPPPIWPVIVSRNLPRVWVVGTPVFTIPKGVFDTFWGGPHLSFTIGI